MSEIEAGASPLSEVEEGGWQLIAGVVVLLGCVASVSYPIASMLWS